MATIRETVLIEALDVYLTQLDEHRAQFGFEDAEIEEKYQEAKNQYSTITGQSWRSFRPNLRPV